MPCVVYIATSLDGYIADREGGLDWLELTPNPEGGDLGFAEFLGGIDALVMGRVTFDTVVAFDCDWPYSKPVFVLSSTRTVVPEDLVGNVEFIDGAPGDVVEALAERGHRRLYVEGGKTIQGFLEADLIDELIVTSIPILLGGGTSLFGALAHRQAYEHVSTEVLLGALVKSRYRRLR